MQVVGANQILGLLSDVAILVGWYQFGADGRIYYIKQSGTCSLVRQFIGHP